MSDNIPRALDNMTEGLERVLRGHVAEEMESSSMRIADAIRDGLYAIASAIETGGES